MKKFIDYCFYRAATFYKEWHDFFYPIPSDDYLIAGAIISYGNLAYNLLSLLIILLHFIFKTTITKKIVFIVSIVVIIGCVFLAKEDRFNKLQKRYKNEKHKTLKGYLVVAYWIGSIIMFGVLLYVFK